MPLMRFSARRFRLWNWIVLVTMLFSTLAPGAVALADPSDGASMQVCTSAGTTVAAGEVDGGDSSDEPAAKLRAACAFCLAGAHAAALPGSLRIAHPAPIAAIESPYRPTPLRPAPAALPPAPPRAPPVSC